MPFWGQGDQPPPFWGHAPVETVDVAMAARAVENGAVLIDLGEPSDWLTGYISGARLVEPELLDEEMKSLSKESPVIVAGRDQGLAEEIVGTMRRKGYNVAALQGGVSAWGRSGHELVHPNARRRDA
jgi:rhodanese-related sulfurtransferase